MGDHVFKRREIIPLLEILRPDRPAGEFPDLKSAGGTSTIVESRGGVSVAVVCVLGRTLHEHTLGLPVSRG